MTTQAVPKLLARPRRMQSYAKTAQAADIYGSFYNTMIDPHAPLTEWNTGSPVSGDAMAKARRTMQEFSNDLNGDDL